MDLKNFAYSTVAAAPSPATSGVTMDLAAGGGALMPAVPFHGVVWPTAVNPLSTNAEIVKVTGIAGDTLTFVRTVEGSASRSIVNGDQFAAADTKKLFREPMIDDTPAEDVFVPANVTFQIGRTIKLSGTMKVDGEVISL